MTESTKRTLTVLATALALACGGEEPAPGSIPATPAPTAPTAPGQPAAPEAPAAPGAATPAAAGEATGEPEAEQPPAATAPGDCESEGAGAEVEGNDDKLHATRVGSGQAVTGTLGRPDDEDWFVLETCGERLVRVALTNAPATSTPVDYELLILGPDGNRRIGTSRDNNGSDGATVLEDVWYVERGEKVFVHVRDHGRGEFDASHGYRLTVTASEVPDAEQEPNGNMNAESNRLLATALTAGEAGAGFIASRGDEDFWKLEVEGETLIEAELSNAPATRSDVDYEMTLLDARGGRLRAERQTNGDSGITVLRTVVYVGEAGPVFVKVNDHGGNDHDGSAAYRVTLTPGAVPDAEQEPNGNGNAETNRALATALPFDAEVTGHIGWHGDEDWFQVAVTEAGALSVQLATAATSSPVDYELTVYDGEGQRLAFERDTNGSDGLTRLTAGVEAVTPGTYYVKVADHGNNEWDLDNSFTLTASQ